MISIIVAVSEDMGIGLNNNLLWHIPDDLKHFKKVTMGKPVIMGKNTWQSLPHKPLPGRENIVLTDIRSDVFEGAHTVYSIGEVLDLAKNFDEVFIIGGGSLYRQFLPMADRLYITHVHKSTAADVFFPPIDPATWETVDTEPYMDAPIPYSYVVYQRR